MRRRRSAKIVATLGPATSTPEKINQLFAAGVDVFRLNFSHGQRDDHRARLDTIRALEKETGRPIGILADMQGPKLRLGTFAEGRIKLAAGKHFRLDLDKAPGDDERAPLPHPEIFAALEPGTELLLNDGNVRLKVESCGEQFAETAVLAGGELSDRKGVNVPNAVLPVTALTAKDRSDLAFALDMGVDWVALSFVQRPEDVAEARKLVAGRAGIMVKLEKPAAVRRLAEIVELSDALMVARGDLGVEMPLEAVPGLQKQIIRAARKAGKPVVVATQMLESMIQAPVPTRAEVSDVANAVYEGADAVMLSAESASGAYPVEAVTMMDRIAGTVESGPGFQSIIDSLRTPPEPTTPSAIMAAVHEVTQTLHARAIICWTKTGTTALRAAHERAEAPIIALTPSVDTARRLSLVWGLHCLVTEEVHSLDEMVDRAVDFAADEGFATVGDRVVITGGVPLGVTGTTNMLRVAMVGAR